MLLDSQLQIEEEPTKRPPHPLRPDCLGVGLVGLVVLVVLVVLVLLVLLVVLVLRGESPENPPSSVAPLHAAHH